MNIFYLSNCPKESAKYMYNKHVVKMILETAQLLSTAHRLLDGKLVTMSYRSGKIKKKMKLDCPIMDEVVYKDTHKNHPSAVWVRESAENYFWAYEHMIALGKEYTRRYGKEHLTITKLKDILYNFPKNIPSRAFVQPPQCMPDEYIKSDAVDGYWAYYIGEKHTVCNKSETPYTKKPNI